MPAFDLRSVTSADIRSNAREDRDPQLRKFDAAAFYRAAVDKDRVDHAPQTVGHSAQLSSHFPPLRPPPHSGGLAENWQRSATWNPPEPPPNHGALSAEDNAEYIRGLFHYMHTLHQQKVTAYEKLEKSIERQNDLEAEIRILKGVLGLPHYATADTARPELVVSHYPRMEVAWVDMVLSGMPKNVSGGCYIIWRPTASVKVSTPPFLQCRALHCVCICTAYARTCPVCGAISYAWPPTIYRFQPRKDSSRCAFR